MNKTYLIFVRNAHSVIYFVRAISLSEAMCKYITEQSSKVVLLPDGSLQDEDIHYPHPLAPIEANEKVHGEWQIRELPEWVLQGHVVEAFCGESQDGPASVIAECRKHFAEAFPKARAKAFVWYLKQGTLVTFYRRKNPFEVVILKRYLWDWDGNNLAIVEWKGGYEQILESLETMPIKQTTFVAD